MKNLFIFVLTTLSLTAYSQIYTGLSDITGTVTSSAIDPNTNAIYVAGIFPTMGNLAYSSDGGVSFAALGTGTNDTIFDLAIFQNRLWICGKFTVVNGIPSKWIAKYNLVTHNFETVKNNDKYGGSIYIGGISDLEVVGDILFACGRSWSISTQPVNTSGVFQYNPAIDTQFIHVAYSNLSNSKMTSDGTNLYTYALDGSTNRINKWDGSTWTLINASYNLNYLPSQIKYYKSAIYMASAAGLVRQTVNPNPPINLNTTPSIALLISNAVLFIGGKYFETYDGVKFDTLGTSNGLITSIVDSPDSTYFIFGNYSTLESSANNVTKYEIFEQPIASFVAANTTSCTTGLTVNFSNQSTGKNLTYKWLFMGADISTATTKDATAIYSSYGSFNVTLIVSNPVGSDTFSQIGFVKIYNPIIPIISQVGDTLISTLATNYEWFYQSNSIDNNSNILIPGSSGDYCVTTIDINGCSATSVNFNYIINGIDEGLHEKLLVYPNPAKSTINISYDKPFTILDMNGANLGVHIKSADLSNLTPGLYFVKLESGKALYFIKR